MNLIEGISIDGVFAAITAVFAFLATRHSKQARDHAAAAEDELKNSHTTNIRDDLTDVGGDVAKVADAVREVNSMIKHLAKHQESFENDVRTEFHEHRHDMTQLAERVHDLEMQPKHAINDL